MHMTQRPSPVSMLGAWAKNPDGARQAQPPSPRRRQESCEHIPMTPSPAACKPGSGVRALQLQGLQLLAEAVRLLGGVLLVRPEALLRLGLLPLPTNSSCEGLLHSVRTGEVGFRCVAVLASQLGLSSLARL